MPFDGRDNTPALNRARLVEALRAELPHDWQWDFSTPGRATECGTAGCALGIARRIWPGALRNASFFGLPENVMHDIFGVIHPDGHNPFYGCDGSEVTPQMVADALERAARGG